MTKRVSPAEDYQEIEKPSKKLHTAHDQHTIDEDLEKKSPGYLLNFIKNPKTIEILKKKGIKELFPIQYKTFHALFAGEDMIAKDRTGSGKTLAFSLPILEKMRAKGVLRSTRDAKFLIILPTRELTIQVFNEINSLRLDYSQFSAVAVYGGSDMRSQINDIRRGVDIIVATPGRLMDLIQKDVIRFDSLLVTCLDEADQMLKLGFQKDIEKIFKQIQKHAPRKTQNLFFSATIPTWIKQMSRRYQDRNCQFVDLINSAQSSTSKTVSHLSIRVDSYEPKECIIQGLINKYNKDNGRVIVFCETKRQVDKISNRLRQIIRCEVLHGDIPQRSRESTFRRFKAGDIRCIVATNVAARGLDFPSIEMVVQVDPPKQTDSYIHRSGRTGRAGKTGIAITLFSEKTEYLINKIERQSKIRMERIYKNDLDMTFTPLSKIQGQHNLRSENIERYGEHELFISGLGSDVNEYDVMDYLKRKDIRVQRVKLLKDGDRSKGCGFITLRDSKGMQDCLELSGRDIKGQRCSIRRKKEY